MKDCPEWTDLRLPCGSPPGNGDRPFWRFTWIKQRATHSPRPDPPARASEPLGWDEGPLKERLEHLSRMKAARPDPLSVGLGPFTQGEAEEIADRILKAAVARARPSELTDIGRAMRLRQRERNRRYREKRRYQEKTA